MMEAVIKLPSKHLRPHAQPIPRDETLNPSTLILSVRCTDTYIMKTYLRVTVSRSFGDSRLTVAEMQA